MRSKRRRLELVCTEYLPPNSFVDAQRQPAKINALWQVWKRGVSNTKDAETCDSWLDLFTVDQRRPAFAGYFLQRTFYRDPPSLVPDFSEVRYVCGYGIVIRKDKRRIVDLLKRTDWRAYSNLAAHNCRHISMCHIRKSLTDAGFRHD